MSEIKQILGIMSSHRAAYTTSTTTTRTREEMDMDTLKRIPYDTIEKYMRKLKLQQLEKFKK